MDKLAVVGLLLAALLLGGCHASTSLPPPTGAPTVTIPAGGGEVDVAFETIARNEGGMGITYDPTRLEPQLLLLTSSEQLGDIESQLAPQTLAALQQVDFAQYAVVALFRGHKGSLNFPTVIERITRQNDRLIVYAQFWEPSSTMASGAEVTYPFHLVKVNKREVASASLQLVLQSRLLTPTPSA